MSRMSIRLRLLLVFMLLFTVVLAVLAAWFYHISTERAMAALRQGLMTAAATAAGMIEADEHAQVYAARVEDSEQYTHIADQLRLVRDGNPLIAAVYTMVRSPQADELIFVVSADENPETRAHLGALYDVSEMPQLLAAFDGPSADEEMGDDEYGVWLSGYAPIRDASGNGVVIVGVDMLAEDVTRVQAQVRNVSILTFAIAYAAVSAAVFVISGSITRPLRAITGAAGALERGEPFEPERLAAVASFRDELGQLARVFTRMAVEVQERERRLQQQVTELRIEIDQAKRERSVAEIADTDYFQMLQEKAKGMRSGRKGPAVP